MFYKHFTENYLRNDVNYRPQQHQPPSSWHQQQVPRRYTLDYKASDQNNDNQSNSDRQVSSSSTSWTTSNTSPEAVSARRTSNETILPDYISSTVLKNGMCTYLN